MLLFKAWNLELLWRLEVGFWNFFRFPVASNWIFRAKAYPYLYPDHARGELAPAAEHSDWEERLVAVVPGAEERLAPAGSRHVRDLDSHGPVPLAVQKVFPEGPATVAAEERPARVAAEERLGLAVEGRVVSLVVEAQPEQFLQTQVHAVGPVESQPALVAEGELSAVPVGYRSAAAGDRWEKVLE